LTSGSARPDLAAHTTGSGSSSLVSVSVDHANASVAEAVQEVYREWTRVGQSVFYADGEKLAVSDHMIVSTSTIYQQTPGAILAAEGVPVDPEATYLVKVAEHLIWPYDDQGRLIGEDVWEYDESVREFIPLDPIDVLTAEQSGKLLAPLIKPLPTHNPFTA
jgi:hypothetical protein